VRRSATILLAGVLLLGLVPSAGAAPESVRVLLTFEQDRAPRAMASGLARSFGGSVAHVYEHALNGAAIDVPAGAVAGLSRAPGVSFAELDGPVTTMATQSSATWGLDRIDQLILPLNSAYVYNSTGSGVTAYIVDTGIRATHTEFGNRVSGGFTAISDKRGTSDCNGHGTHVAGTVGGAKYGVAKSVSLVPVRVLNCQGSGTWSGVISGLDWIVANKAPKSVANMSLGGGANTTVDNAVVNVLNAGVMVVVAAGNSTADACGSSPARVPAALTVGATTSTDLRASYSNFGTCLDLFAPGSSITSAWHSSNTAINTISGTSMAAPHVAGVVALWLQGQTAGQLASTVASEITGKANKGRVIDARVGSPNLLLDAHLRGPRADDAAPTVAFTPADNATVSGTVKVAVEAQDGGGDSLGALAVDVRLNNSGGWVRAPWNASTARYEVTWDTTKSTDGSHSLHVHATDATGNYTTATNWVTVANSSSATSTGAITLTATKVNSKSTGMRTDLAWTGASGGVDVWRNDVMIATNVTGTTYSDPITAKGTYRYKVCPTGGTATCSNEVQVSF
jgi:subtilisin family serine protease